jgi:serpin B
MHAAARAWHPRPLTPLALLLVVALTAACGTEVTPTPGATGATPAPSAQPTTASPAVSIAPTAEPSATPVIAPDAQLAGVTPGALAVTVSDGLRVRSQPGVSADSLKYTPLLPLGTPLVVAAGPVDASGYTWFRVAPIGVKLSGGADQGWVAVADHDGTPWVAVSDDPTPGFELAAASLDRPAADLAAAKAEAKALNEFGIALYKRMLKDPEIAPPGKGVVFSPASIVTALAMARAGARGDTAADMDRVLRVDGWEELGSGLSSLDLLLRSRDAAWEEYEGAGGSPHQLALRTANMAFGQEGYALEDAYLERLGRTFGSGLGLVDYINESDAAREAINAWVSRQTMGRIPELLKPPNVTDATRLVLVNAIYLKAEWARAFDEDRTAERTFTNAGGDSIKVPTMQVTGEQDIPLASGDGWKATELRYLGPDGTTPLAMTVVLPDDLDAFEGSLTPKVLASISSKLKKERALQQKLTYTPEDWADMRCGNYAYSTNLFMPRFGIDTRADLIPSLQALGMDLPFDPKRADFTGMTAADRLFIGMVIHQANIDVDEKGTEAAAATAVGMDTTGGCGGPQPLKTKTLRLDKPFLFMLRDVQTSAILFMGRVTDPTQR